jgi:hypothetical protein
VLQISVLGAARALDLHEGRVTLAGLLEQPRVQRTGIRVGLLGRDVVVEPLLHHAFMSNRASGSSACRRYQVTVDGVPGGVVLEVLPCEVWERMVESSETREAGSRP